MSAIATRVVVPRQVAPGDPRHGVVLFARQLADAVGRPLETTVRPGEPAHVHVTDRLWGPRPEAAAQVLERLAHGAPLTVTFHDVPQPAEGAGRMARRAAAYRRIARAAHGVAVSSEHEAALLQRHVGVAADVVVPLPVDPAPSTTRPPTTGEVGVLGWVYPGKGHRDVLDAVRPGTTVVALGRPSPGHEADVDALARHALARGVRFTVTGWLDDGQLLDRSRRIAVPVAAHRHVSASGSIGSWIAAGRRPLVLDSPYAREVERLRPGCTTRVAPHDLPRAIARAQDAADSTWLLGATMGPGLDDVAAAYRRWWAEGVAW